MDIELVLAGIVSPDTGRPFMPDKFAVLLQERGGHRRCLIGFPRQYFPYVATAIGEVVMGMADCALHGAMVRMLDRAGTTVERMRIWRNRDDNFGSTVSLRQGGDAWEQQLFLSDALPLAFHARCPVFMSDSELTDAERRYHEVEGRFILVDSVGEFPMKLADRLAAKSGKLTPQ